MPERMTVHRDGAAIYDIVLSSSFENLKEELEKLEVKNRKLFLVSDSNVAPLYLEQVRELLAGCCRGMDTFVFPAGEEQKNLDTVRELYQNLIEKKYDRNDMLVALGGGVVGDLCGFGAATYLRGVDFIQIPTTLLSQVDSSVGGKTGVDFDTYKNMVGAFHMPKLVYINTETLKTLSDEQFSSGMGEIIKHGLIKDQVYFEWLSCHIDDVNRRDSEACATMIAWSDRIKRDVVEKDPTEKGDRALLNFGHTLGHAIEKLKNFSMLHGHCVGLGVLAAAHISVKRGLLEETQASRIRQLMEGYGMPVSVSGLNMEEVLQATKNDKKMVAGAIKFILLDGIGTAFIDRTVSEEEMRDGLAFVLAGGKA